MTFNTMKYIFYSIVLLFLVGCVSDSGRHQTGVVIVSLNNGGVDTLEIDIPSNWTPAHVTYLGGALVICYGKKDDRGCYRVYDMETIKSFQWTYKGEYKVKE